MSHKKIFFSILISSFALLGCGGGIEELAQNSLYPYESINKKYPVQETPPEGLSEVKFDLKNSAGEDYSIHGWFYGAHGPRGNVLVYFHGNGENLQTMLISNFIGVMKQLGVNFVVVDYPAYGRSTGIPSEETVIAAAKAAIQFANSKTSAKVVVWGRSLGASVAILATKQLHSVVDRLALTSPWTNFYDVAVGMSGLARQIPASWIEKNKYDSLAAVGDISKRVLIHHGQKDKLIPIAMGRQISLSFNNASDVTMFEFASREHNDIFQENKLWTDIQSFSK